MSTINFLISSISPTTSLSHSYSWQQWLMGWLTLLPWKSVFLCCWQKKKGGQIRVGISGLVIFSSLIHLLIAISFIIQLCIAPQLTLISKWIIWLSRVINMDVSHSFIQGQCNSSQWPLLRTGKIEFYEALWVQVDPFLLYSEALYLIRVVHWLLKIYGVSCCCCAALRGQPLSILKEWSQDVACQLQCLSSQSQQEKKPITSSDTAWQHCLNGRRHARQQWAARRGRLYQCTLRCMCHFSQCTCSCVMSE